MHTAQIFANPFAFSNQIEEASKMLEKNNVEPDDVDNYLKNVYVDDAADEERDVQAV